MLLWHGGPTSGQSLLCSVWQHILACKVQQDLPNGDFVAALVNASEDIYFQLHMDVARIKLTCQCCLTTTRSQSRWRHCMRPVWLPSSAIVCKAAAPMVWHLKEKIREDCAVRGSIKERLEWTHAFLSWTWLSLRGRTRMGLGISIAPFYTLF